MKRIACCVIRDVWRQVAPSSSSKSAALSRKIYFRDLSSVFCVIFLARGGGVWGGGGWLLLKWMHKHRHAHAHEHAARLLRHRLLPLPSAHQFLCTCFTSNIKLIYSFVCSYFQNKTRFGKRLVTTRILWGPFRDFEEEFDVFFRKRRTLMVEGVDGTSLFLRSVTPKQRGILSFISGNCALEGMVN